MGARKVFGGGLYCVLAILVSLCSIAAAQKDLEYVSTAKAFQDAVINGVRHIILSNHIDMRQLPPDESATVPNTTLRIGTTKSIRGACADASFPPDITLDPPATSIGQCLIFVAAPFLELSKPGVQLLLSDVYVLILRPPPSPSAVVLPLISVSQGSLWMASTVLRGDQQKCRALAVGPGMKTHSRLVHFVGFQADVAAAVRCEPGSRAGFKDCSFTINAATGHGSSVGMISGGADQTPAATWFMSCTFSSNSDPLGYYISQTDARSTQYNNRAFQKSVDASSGNLIIPQDLRSADLAAEGFLVANASAYEAIAQEQGRLTNLAVVEIEGIDAGPPSSSGSSGVPLGAIIGGICGAVGFIIIGLAVVLYLRRRSRTRRSDSPPAKTDLPNYGNMGLGIDSKRSDNYSIPPAAISTNSITHSSAPAGRYFTPDSVPSVPSQTSPFSRAPSNPPPGAEFRGSEGSAAVSGGPPPVYGAISTTEEYQARGANLSGASSFHPSFSGASSFRPSFSGPSPPGSNASARNTSCPPRGLAPIVTSAHRGTATGTASAPSVASTSGVVMDRDALEEALDDIFDNRILFLGRFEVYSQVHRRVGGQGIVQFVRGRYDEEEYAIKFFLNRAAFEREQALYVRADLRRMMPAVKDILPNANGAICSASGFVFPPSIVVERGESLDEWALRIEPDFPTILTVLCHILARLQQLHGVGIAHRDLKPGNVLWRPKHHAWTLIDFGCAAEIGTTCPLSFSLLYSPPECILAIDAGQRTTVADPAADMWALGVISFELLTARRAFPRTLSVKEVSDQITGRAPLPWETPDFRKKNVPELRMLRRTIMSCLSRDPLKRPTSSELLQSWNSLFDHATKGAATNEMEQMETSDSVAQSSLNTS